jgi:hypothetical protein
LPTGGTDGTLTAGEGKQITMRKLVEDQPSISAHALYRAGSLHEGASTRWDWAGRSVEISAHATRAVFVIDGQEPVEVTITWHPGTLGGAWPSWKCRCGRGAYLLYPVEGLGLGCRRCARLDYATHVRWSPALWKVQRLRRKLGPRPTSGGHASVCYNRLVGKIVAHELKALIALNAELRRKGPRHGGKRQRR